MRAWCTAEWTFYLFSLLAFVDAALLGGWLPRVCAELVVRVPP